MVALYFLFYNFARVHSTLRVTPAMEAGLSDHVWTIDEICALLPAKKSPAAQMGKGIILKTLKEQQTQWT